MKFTQIYEALNNANKIAIFVHTSPDADCLGSAVALGGYLQNINKSVDFFCDDDIHSNFSVIGGEFKKELNDDYDLMIAVDCADVMRMGKFSKVFREHKNTINIDHHGTNTNFAKINYVAPAVSNTINLFEMFKDFGVELDKNIATAIYAGIIGDTGGLSYGELSPKVFNIVAELVGYDIDLDNILYYLLRRRSFNQVKLLQLALNSLCVDDGFASMVITLKDFEQTNTTNLDVFGFVNYAVNIDDVEVAVCLCEYEPNKFQVSIRSKGGIDASKIASAFGGGGHKRASGCRIFGCVDKCIKKFRQAVKSL